MEQTCCCQGVESCGAVIFVWQVRDESTMICVSDSLKTFDFQELPNDVGWQSVGFLIREGWVIFLYSFPVRVTLIATSITPNQCF